LAVCLSRRLKGSSTPAYKGAWRGHHGGSGVDTIWSPRLSPIQRRILHGKSAMGYPATGLPGRLSAIPPSMGHPGLLVQDYVTGIPIRYIPTLSPRNFKIAISIRYVGPC
jgi:hypothetical protein